MQPTAVVTGANSGIGAETALGLARAGLHVVMACRSVDRGETARQALLERHPEASLEVRALDLADAASIEAFAAGLDAPLQVLVNNAGAWYRSRRETSEGLEATFAINHLGPFRLTRALLPCLHAAPKARIVTVASAAHWMARPDWHDLQMGHGYDGDRQYANSKLYNMWFSHALARRLEGTGITSNCLHPGMGRTGLTRDFPSWVDPVLRVAGKSPARLAATSIRLATGPSMDGVSGGYFHMKRRGRQSRNARDRGAAERMWTLTHEMA